MPSRADWSDFLAERPIAVLATVSTKGMPHAAPVEVLVRDGKVYVWCESDSVKARNALATGLAALTAYKGQEGVLVRGPVRSISDGYDEITKGFLEKYKRDETFGNDLLLEISPERIAAWD